MSVRHNGPSVTIAQTEINLLMKIVKELSSKNSVNLVIL